VEAELVMGLSKRLRIPPVAGGVMDQPAWVLRTLRILDLADPDQKREAPELDLADLQELI
jgi:hypothetical protein